MEKARKFRVNCVKKVLKGMNCMEKTMKAVVLHAPGNLVCEEVEVPLLGKNDVLVKVLSCGVCGSDISRVLTTGTYHFPTIPGHEFGGIVTEVGEAVEENIIGRRVAVIPLIPCMKCKMCEKGMYAQCEGYDFLGSRSDGGFAEYVKVPRGNLVFVPEQVNDDEIGLLEPISVALNVVEKCNVKYGDNVAIFGLGAIGIFIAQWAKIFGAKHVFAIDIDRNKVDIARQLNLEDAVCSIDDNVHDLIKKKTNSKMIDVVFEATGAEGAFNLGIDLLRISGVMGLVGRPADKMSISNKAYEKILRGEITIQGSWSFKFNKFPHNDWEISLEALADKKILTEPIISHRLPLNRTFDAIKIMDERKEKFHKIIIKPQL